MYLFNQLNDSLFVTQENTTSLPIRIVTQISMIVEIVRHISMIMEIFSPAADILSGV